MTPDAWISALSEAGDVNLTSLWAGLLDYTAPPTSLAIDSDGTWHVTWVNEPARVEITLSGESATAVASGFATQIPPAAWRTNDHPPADAVTMLRLLTLG